LNKDPNLERQKVRTLRSSLHKWCVDGAAEGKRVVVGCQNANSCEIASNKKKKSFLPWDFLKD